MAREVIEIGRTFGKPSLTSRNNGKTSWDRGSTLPLDQKSPTGWLARLYGGVQTNDDYARVEIPVSELPTPHFKTASWTYYQTSGQEYGVNMVIWLHDPTDNNKRVEVTQAPSGITLENGAGWNAHELDTSVTQFFYYGEGMSGLGSGLNAGEQYTWAQFQTDAVFLHWTIYKITLEWGWYSTGTFEDAWVADIKLNNQIVQLEPSPKPHKKTVIVSKTMNATAKTAAEVISEHTSSGTDWPFDFGGTGYITKAIVTHDAAVTPRLNLYLFTRPVQGAVFDEAANDNPLTAEIDHYVGVIEFPAMTYQGTGDASALATPNTTGNLPLAFDAPVLYGVLVAVDAVTTVAEDLTIALTGDMED